MIPKGWGFYILLCLSKLTVLHKDKGVVLFVLLDLVVFPSFCSFSRQKSFLLSFSLSFFLFCYHQLEASSHLDELSLLKQLRAQLRSAPDPESKKFGWLQEQLTNTTTLHNWVRKKDQEKTELERNSEKRESDGDCVPTKISGRNQQYLLIGVFSSF